MAAFSFDRVKSFTGKVQFRIDGSSVVTANGKSWKRGEVKEVKSPIYANGIVSTGNFAHVAVDTPIGVPGDGEDFSVERDGLATNEPRIETTEDLSGEPAEEE